MLEEILLAKYINKHPQIKHLFFTMADEGYENVLGKLRNDVACDSDKKILQGIEFTIGQIFRMYHLALGNNISQVPLSLVSEIIYGTYEIESDPMLFFTTNHDLVLERFSPHWTHLPIHLPGISNEVDFNHWLDLPKVVGDPTVIKLDSNAINYIKLHGSINREQTVRNLLIQGTTKETSLRDNRLLTEYWHYWIQFLSEKDSLLLIIGNSLRDSHLRIPIVDSICNHNLKVRIIDPYAIDIASVLLKEAQEKGLDEETSSQRIRWISKPYHQIALNHQDIRSRFRQLLH